MSWESHGAGGVLGITLLRAWRGWGGQVWVCAATSGQSGTPQGWVGGILHSPHSHFEAEVLLWLRDMVGVVEEGAALSAGVSVETCTVSTLTCAGIWGCSGTADYEESRAGRAASPALGLDTAEPIGAPRRCCQEPPRPLERHTG